MKKSIQEIAKDSVQYFKKFSVHDRNTATQENRSEVFWNVANFAGDKYLRTFLELSLYDIGDINGWGDSTPDDMRLSSDWSEPDFPEWTFKPLWEWLTSDSSHLQQVQEHIFECHKSGVEPNLDKCIQYAVWDEWRMVFEAVKLYLVEEWEAQPDEEEEESDCDEDGE